MALQASGSGWEEQEQNQEPCKTERGYYAYTGGLLLKLACSEAFYFLHPVEVDAANLI